MKALCRFLIRFMLEMMRTRRAVLRDKDKIYNDLALEFHRSLGDGRTLARVLAEKNAEIERLQGEVLRDPLTNLLNRRGLREIIHPEIHLLQRSSVTFVSVSVVMIDIDHFKRVNDVHGHGTGDTVLRCIAAHMSAVFRRDVDHLFRFGGEEFVIISLHTSLAMAGKLTEVLRQRIASDETLRLEETGQVTASFGISLVNTNDRNVGAAITAACDEADKALYAAKAAGRNTVIMANEGQY